MSARLPAAKPIDVQPLEQDRLAAKFKSGPPQPDSLNPALFKSVIDFRNVISILTCFRTGNFDSGDRGCKAIGSLGMDNLATWNGEIVVGGEPAWFREAARAGTITRSGDGVGPCLVVEAALGYELVGPGGVLERSDDGSIKVLTLDSAIGRLQALARAPSPNQARSPRGAHSPAAIRRHAN